MQESSSAKLPLSNVAMYSSSIRDNTTYSCCNVCADMCCRPRAGLRRFAPLHRICVGTRRRAPFRQHAGQHRAGSQPRRYNLHRDGRLCLMGPANGCCHGIRLNGRRTWIRGHIATSGTCAFVVWDKPILRGLWTSPWPTWRRTPSAAAVRMPQRWKDKAPHWAPVYVCPCTYFVNLSISSYLYFNHGMVCRCVILVIQRPGVMLKTVE